MSSDLKITLEYRGPDRMGIQNWDGPGWYLHASDNEGDWAVEPVRLTFAQVGTIARAMDGVRLVGGSSVASAVMRQAGRARMYLVDRVKRLEAVERELAGAREHLAQYETMGKP